MFRASSAHLQEYIVVYMQHMLPSLSIRVLVACRYAARVRTDWRWKVVVGCLKTHISTYCLCHLAFEEYFSALFNSVTCTYVKSQTKIRPNLHFILFTTILYAHLLYIYSLITKWDYAFVELSSLLGPLWTQNDKWLNTEHW